MYCLQMKKLLADHRKQLCFRIMDREPQHLKLLNTSPNCNTIDLFNVLHSLDRLDLAPGYGRLHCDRDYC